MRRRGIGDALVTSVKDWARSGGHNALNLWVVSLNAPAMALYRRCGFLPSGRARPLAHTPDLMELHMLVELAQT
jgi:GNAT superfamily N-acetyltransferase